MKKKTTLKDVAREAGVSAMSVSKALNNKGGLSEDTRKRILETAKRLNYTQNMIAKSLRVDETKTIGVVLSDSSELVMGKVLRGIQDAASENEYSVIIANTDHVEAVEHKSVEVLVNKRIDGLLLVAPVSASTEDVAWMKTFSTPIVLLMRQSKEKQLDAVINDNFLGGYQMISHLVQRGAKKIAFLPLDETSQSGGERLNGGKQALKEMGIPFDSEKVFFTRPFIENGYKNAKRLLKSGYEFDALVCGCDMIAIGAMKALKEYGKKIPQDVKVTGYDDVELAGYLQVPLTTMHQPLYEIGYQGMQVLLERIQRPQMPIRKIVMESKLTIRDST